jgi:hypothetical protein
MSLRFRFPLGGATSGAEPLSPFGLTEIGFKQRFTARRRTWNRRFEMFGAHKTKNLPPHRLIFLQSS